MFSCTRKPLHSKIWSMPSASCATKMDCFICLLNQLTHASITCVQKQVALQVIITVLNNGDSHVCEAILQNPIVGYKIIDTSSELQVDESLQDSIMSVCVLTVSKILKKDGFKYLLTKFMEAVHSVDEESIQFCMSLVSSLISMHQEYVEVLLTSYGDLIIQLLDKAELMDEKMTTSLIHILIPVVDNKNHFADLDGYDNITTHLLPLMNTWLMTSQSLDLKKIILMLLREMLQYRHLSLCLLSYGEVNSNGSDKDILSQSLTPPDSPFLMGLKRMMTCKEAELTIICVQCLTQILNFAHGTEYLRGIMACDLPEFVFESLHTSDNNQLETTFECINVMVDTDEFFQRCHAVYGIDTVLKTVREAINSQRLSVAVSGLRLLWCILEKQPGCMPLLLNHSWRSCHQLICQALQHENNTIFISGLQVAASFLRPQHQQTPVDIQAIMFLICTIAPKIEAAMERQGQHQSNSCTNTNTTDNETHLLVINSLMDVFVHIISLFQTDVILPGNDKNYVSDLRHVLQSIAPELLVSKVFLDGIRKSLSIGKYLNFIEGAIFIKLYDPESKSRLQTSKSNDAHEFFSHLLKSNLPWHILGFVSLARCRSLEEQASKLVVQIFSLCMESLPSALHFDPDLFHLGLIQLEWNESGFSLDCIPSDKNALIAVLTILYFSYLFSSRPWSLYHLFHFFHKVFSHFPSYLSWHPMMLRSTIYILAISESLLQDHDIHFEQSYESAVIAELEKNSINLWYTDCVEILAWTLSSHRRHVSVGNKTVEFWVHQIALKENVKDEINTNLLHFKDCLPFYQSIVDLQESNTAGKMASSIITAALQYEPSAISKEKMLQWNYEKLKHLLSEMPKVDEPVVDNILSLLYVLIGNESFQPSISYLHDVKTVCQIVRYLTEQEMGHCRMINALKYLSVLVKKITTQESEIVIPPVIQNTKIVQRLMAALSESNKAMLEYVLTLCAWLSTHATDFQTTTPLIITTKQLLSFLATCKRADAGSVLRLLKAALFNAQNGNKRSGAVRFVKNKQGYFSSNQIFNDLEIYQIHWYAMQYLMQETLPEKEIAIDVLDITFAIKPEASLQFVHNPWISLLIENIITKKEDTSLCQVDLQMYTLMSVSDEMWTATYANSFLTALSNSDWESLEIKDIETIISKIKKKTELYNPHLLSEIEKKIDSALNRLL